MIKKLVAFGCSWTFGDELNDPTLIDKKEKPFYDELNTPYRLEHSWPGLIAKHYKLEYENHAFPGASLGSMRDAVTWYVKNHDVSDSFFIIGLTDSARWSWHDNKYTPKQNDPKWNTHINSAWILNNIDQYPVSWQQTFQNYINDQLCDELQKKNLNQSLLFFDGIAARNNVPMLQVSMLDYFNDLIRVPTYYDINESIRDKLTRHTESETLFQSGRHPNEKGHKIIANWLIDYINSVKIIEC